jgi:putative nucleotidyltransferase with HDIG domain
MNTLDAIKKRIDSYLKMPALSSDLLEGIQDPDADFQSLANKLQYDPGTTANILKLANSAYFGAPQSITSLRAAFVRLGTKNIFQLLVAQGMADTLKSPLKGYDLQPCEFMHHSVMVAVACEEICKLLKLHTSDIIFTAGLLHDIGKIILDDFIAKKSAEISKAIFEQKLDMCIAEETLLGINHAETGAKVLKKWLFPAELVETAHFHHHPHYASSEYSKTVNIVHLANTLAHSIGIGAGKAAAQYTPDMEVMKGLKINTSMLEYVASQSLLKMKELSTVLGTTATPKQKRRGGG